MPWLLPLACGLVILIVLPLLGTLALSLFEYDALSAARWIGWDHYRSLASDELFRLALANSLLVASLTVSLRLILVLVLLPLIAQPSRWARWALLLLLLPIAIPEIVWSTAWVWLLNPHFGPIAWGLDALHPQGAQWLLGATGARSSLVLISSLVVGEMLLILVLARRQIKPELFELAKLEGLGALRQFRLISLPILLPLILLLAARDFALAFQTSFMPAMIVTKGGPQFASYLLPQYVFESSFEYLRFGFAASMSSVMLALTAAILIAQALLLWRWLPREHSR